MLSVFQIFSQNLTQFYLCFIQTLQFLRNPCKMIELATRFIGWKTLRKGRSRIPKHCFCNTALTSIQLGETSICSLFSWKTGNYVPSWVTGAACHCSLVIIIRKQCQYSSARHQRANQQMLSCQSHRKTHKRRVLDSFSYWLPSHILKS